MTEPDPANPLRFRFFPHLNSPGFERATRFRGQLSDRFEACFPGDGLGDRFARALAARRALTLKEVLESFEFFGHARKHVRRTVVTDLCAGHGLVGILFALLDRSVERVVLVDRRRPRSRGLILEAADEVAPWVRPKLVEIEKRMERASLEPGSAVVSVHACGTRTDTAIDLAIRLGGPVALLPCCRSHARSPAPEVLSRELGGDLAFDIDRTYRLERAGYHVRWSHLPVVITPQNRVIVARPRVQAGSP